MQHTGHDQIDQNQYNEIETVRMEQSRYQMYSIIFFLSTFDYTSALGN